MPRQATHRRLPALVAAAGLAALCAAPATAAEGEAALRAELEALKRRISELERRLAEQQEAQQRVEKLEREVKEVAKTHSEWKDAESVLHVAGYAAVGYTDAEGADGSFNVANFNPIFHFLYDDKVLWEAELEFEVLDDGSTKTNLEYTTLDWFVTDNVTLVGGKFLSPAGFFIQNLHPAWINKLPSKPAGFGEEQAAPESDLGLEVRGGVNIGNPWKLTYAFYVANGPSAEGELGGGEIERIEAEAKASDEDGDKVYGGRVSVLPRPGLEIGVSAVTGKLMVEDGTSEDKGRDYDLVGADFSLVRGNLDARAEYVRQRIGARAGSLWPDEAEWKAWYAQLAWKFRPTRFEGVVRYSDYDSPHAAEDQRQWALGLNYLLAPNAVAKVAYELNDGQSGQPTDDDRFLLQFAYGF